MTTTSNSLNAVRTSLRTLCATLGFAALLTSAAQAQYTYTDLLINGQPCVPKGIDGNRIVGATGSDGFIYDGTNSVTPAKPPGTVSAYLAGLSGNTALGQYSTAENYFIHIYTFDLVSSTSTPLPKPSATSFQEFAGGISGTRIVGVYFDSFDGTHAFIYDGTNYTILSAPLGANGTYAMGISGDNIVGFYADAAYQNHGFLYNLVTGVYTTIDHPLGTSGTFPSSISGNLVAGYYADDYEMASGFVYNLSTGTFITVNHAPNDTGNTIFGISGTTLVGQYQDSEQNYIGFVARPAAAASTTTALTSSSNPSTFGSSVTFTATVSPSAATGTVTFMDGAATLGTGTLSGGVATFATSSLSAGGHSLTAEYGGDSGYLGSTNSPALTQTVAAAPGTHLYDNLGNTPFITEAMYESNTWAASQFTTDAHDYLVKSVVLLLYRTGPSTAQLDLYSDAGGGPGTSLGTLTSPGDIPLNTAAEVTFTTPGISLPANSTYWVVLRAPTGQLWWSYTEDTNGTGVGFSFTNTVSVDAGASWNPPLDYWPNQLQINADLAPAPEPTALALAASLNPSTYGTSVTFTATVSPSAATGTVTFKDGANTLGTGTLSGGVTTFTTNGLSAGSHSLTAEYAGDSSYRGSTNSPLTQTVNPAAASVTLTNLVQLYNGAARSATATTLPAGLPVALTYDGAGSAPTNVGAYTVTATITDPNYIGGATNTLYIATAPEVQTVAQASGNITFGWSAQAGLTYQASYATNLTPPVVWTDLGSRVTATNSVMTTTEAVNADEAMRFYRVRLVLP